MIAIVVQQAITHASELLLSVSSLYHRKHIAPTVLRTKSMIMLQGVLDLIMTIVIGDTLRKLVRYLAVPQGDLFLLRSSCMYEGVPSSVTCLSTSSVREESFIDLE